jgi:hypothetical protein
MACNNLVMFHVARWAIHGIPFSLLMRPFDYTV